MNETISIHEFNNNPIYEDVKIGDILFIKEKRIRGYNLAEYYPFRIENINISKDVKISYDRIINYTEYQI